MAALLQAALRDQLSTPTWLLVGASFQTIALAVLPVKYVVATTLGLLAFVATRSALRVFGWLAHSPSPPIIPGRYSPRPPPSLEPQPMTVFILGFQSSHPLGRFAPGIKELGEYFNGIVKEAEAKKTTSGYLGSSTPMLTMDGDAHNALITISYWNDVAKLEQFAKQGVHLKAIMWFNEFRTKSPHIGIMHETYACPAGSYETVYHNFRPFGLAKTSYEIDNELGEKEIVKAQLAREGPHLDTMYGRMGRSAE